ncbi:MAG: serine O-acetyltransferase, partial [Pseudomonadota bacterium]|nr:serine O-acetyltransferase [Pseudomonadota bacterium]
MAKSRQSAQPHIKTCDPQWAQLLQEAEAVRAHEPALASFVYATVLAYDRLEDAVCHRLAQRLSHVDVDAGLLMHTFDEVLAAEPALGDAFRADLAAV